jgi:hypothetical protein
MPLLLPLPPLLLLLPLPPLPSVPTLWLCAQFIPSVALGPSFDPLDPLDPLWRLCDFDLPRACARVFPGLPWFMKCQSGRVRSSFHSASVSGVWVACEWCEWCVSGV